MSVQMKITGLMFDPVTDMPIVILKDDSGTQVLPIWVGLFEANAIAVQLDEIEPPRPMTHDLLRSVIEHLEARVARVVITDLRDNTFYATIQLDRGPAQTIVDARPSDAMALALRAGAPIFVEEEVLRKSTTGDGADRSYEETERLRRWLEQVDPEELGKYQM